MKKFLAILMALVMLLSATACGLDFGGGDSNGDSGSDSGKSGGGLKWFTEVFSGQNIDEFTKGRIVYTESYDGKYIVYFDNCTADDFKEWVGKLTAKGFRMDEYDTERVANAGGWNYVEVYEPTPGSPYFLELYWNFQNKESFEWYGEDDSGAIVQWKTDEYGDTYGYVEYNLSIRLLPLNTEKKTEGSFLGVNASDLVFDNVRTVTLSGEGMLPGGKVTFYADYCPTKEDHTTYVNLLIDKLAAAGATFEGTLDGAAKTAQELKDSGISSFNVTVNGEKYYLMNTSEWGHYGDAFGFSCTKLQK